MPLHYQLHFEVARLLSEIGQSEKAKLILAQGHLGAGWAYERNGKPEQALQEYEKCLLQNPGHGKAKIRHVEVLLSLNEHDRAQELMLDYARDKSSRLDMLVIRLRVAADKSDFKEAEDLFFEFWTVDGLSEYALRTMYKMALKHNKMPFALNSLDHLTDDRCMDLWGNLAKIKLAEVLSDDVNFLNINRNEPVYWQALELLSDTGMHDFVIDRLSKTTFESEQDISALTIICKKYRARREEDRLLELLGQLPLDAWENYELMAIKSSSLCRGISYRACFEYLEQKIQEHGEVPVLCFNLAMQKIFLHVWYEAEKMSMADVDRYWSWVETQWLNEDDDPVAHLCLACYLHTRGYLEHSLDFLYKARSIGLPGGWQVMSAYWLAKVLSDLGRFQEAKDVFEDLFQARAHKSWDIANKLAFKAQLESELA